MKQGVKKIKLIKIKKGEYYFLDDKFFLVKKGRVLTRDILISGRAIPNEHFVKEGELVGNFFKFIKNDFSLLPELSIEIEALEDSYLEEFNFSFNEILENEILEKILLQLVKKSILRSLEHIYDTKGYMLSVMKLYANAQNEINKKELNYKNFNIGKSQYYYILSKLKEDEYITDEKKVLRLDLVKIDNYLANYDESAY